MAITKVSKTRNAGALLRYVLEDKAHNGASERYISANSFNCTLSNAKGEFKKIIDRYNKQDHVQAYTIIKSWSREELNPNDEDDIRKGQESANRLARDVAGDDRQVVVVLQRDGKGGNLHAHIVMGSIEMSTGKSMRGDKKEYSYIREKSDEIDRELEIKNLNAVEREYTDKQSIQEIKARDKGAYVWKDDIKERISNCMNNPSILTYDDFKKTLEEDYGVQVKERKSSKKEAYGGYLLTYTFTDKNNKERRVRENRLGTVYGLKGLEYATTQHNKRYAKQSKEHDNTEHELKRQKQNRELNEQNRRLSQQLESERQRQLDKERDRERTRELDSDYRELELEYRKLKQKQYQRSL